MNVGEKLLGTQAVTLMQLAALIDHCLTISGSYTACLDANYLELLRKCNTARILAASIYRKPELLNNDNLDYGLVRNCYWNLLAALQQDLKHYYNLNYQSKLVADKMADQVGVVGLSTDFSSALLQSTVIADCNDDHDDNDSDSVDVSIATVNPAANQDVDEEQLNLLAIPIVSDKLNRILRANVTVNVSTANTAIN